MASLLMIKQDNNVIMFLKMYKIRVNVYNKKHKIRVEEKTKTIDMEEFVLDFVEEGSITEIDVVMEVTGLTYEEVKSCCKILVID